MADYVLVAFSPRCSVTAIGLCPDPSTVCVHVHRLERQTALTVRETGYEEQLSRQIESGRPELRNRACIRNGAKRPDPHACSPRHHAGALLRTPRNEQQQMTEPPRRVVGKRQVRPNLSRADFGYTPRPMSTPTQVVP